MRKTILVTGAAGYIGSHFVEAVFESSPAFLQGAKLGFLDNLSSGHDDVIARLKQLAKEKSFPEPEFFKVDLLDVPGLEKAISSFKPEAVLHFAAKISVAESVANPDLYFENNVLGSKNLLNAMKNAGCTRMVFSSTAAVYGSVEDPVKANLPLSESTPLKPVNPYGKTKLMMEEVIQGARSEWGLKSVIFRYFNAAGASVSGRFGECHEPETHLIPLIIQAALNHKPVTIFGTQYPTRDGSCVRDYIHVTDLASAHLLGLEKLFTDENFENRIFNLGTANGTSVLEVLEAFGVLTGEAVASEIKANRPGDSAVLVADSSKARAELGWKPRHSSMHDILKSGLAWEKARRA